MHVILTRIESTEAQWSSRLNDVARMTASVAIIGSGPTGIYTLSGLIKSKRPLLITVFEIEADAGKGTPYHPHINDQAMLANIASIELPAICETLVGGCGDSPTRNCSD